jgi:hypothetical protein
MKPYHIKLLCTCCIFLSVSGKLFAQQPDSPVNSFWYKWNDDILKRIDLKEVYGSNDNDHLRIWYGLPTISFIVDLYKMQDSTSKGMITIYTKEVVAEANELPTNRIYSNQVSLSKAQSDSLSRLIHDTQILSLPTDSLIKGWQQGFDGVTYCLEYINKGAYSFKSYWTPTAQEKLKEAIIVQSFIDTVAEIVHINSLMKEFKGNIPFESYNTGGPSTAIRVLTTGQRRKYKRERDAYRKLHGISNK